MNHEFWDYLQHLVDTSKIVIDRPKGSMHPRFPGKVYPVDYGFLEGTTSIDSSGVDIWVGSLVKHKVVGILCTVDLLKRDTELKILFDCTDQEIRIINGFVNVDDMRAVNVISREEN
jgi:inorganic pyrophosphatase